ncbi:MAG: O-methyltransferase [Bacteroidales bacterium]
METPSEKYIREHSTPQTAALDWIQKQSNIRTNYPRMISGQIQGNLLRIITEMLRPENVLEIGTFTGYSAVCIASGLSETGHIDTLEINDEMEDLIRDGFARAGVEKKISLIIGDAKESLLELKRQGREYGLVFMDANKREYLAYYDLLFDMVKPGGIILADDVLWDGKVYEENLPVDKQTRGIAAFNDMIVKDPRVESVILPIRDGINLIRKKSLLPGEA